MVILVPRAKHNNSVFFFFCQRKKQLVHVTIYENVKDKTISSGSTTVTNMIPSDEEIFDIDF